VSPDTKLHDVRWLILAGCEPLSVAGDGGEAAGQVTIEMVGRVLAA